MLANPIIASLAAVLLWFFSTGAILFVVNRTSAPGKFANRLGVVVLGLPFLIFGIFGVKLSLESTSVEAVYLGFVSALCIWGWVELAFLSGVITGPNRKSLPLGVRGGLRFVHSITVMAYNISILSVMVVVMYAFSATADNQAAFGAFGILFVARMMANLNLFFGVPGINTEAVPEHLGYLKTYFRKGDPSWFFPLSIIILCGLMGVFMERVLVADEPQHIVTSTLLASLCGLALLEHCMMLVPLADAKLWRWMTPWSLEKSKHTRTARLKNRTTL